MATNTVAEEERLYTQQEVWDKEVKAWLIG